MRHIVPTEEPSMMKQEIKVEWDSSHPSSEQDASPPPNDDANNTHHHHHHHQEQPESGASPAPSVITTRRHVRTITTTGHITETLVADEVESADDVPSPPAEEKNQKLLQQVIAAEDYHHQDHPPHFIHLSAGTSPDAENHHHHHHHHHHHQVVAFGSANGEEIGVESHQSDGGGQAAAITLTIKDPPRYPSTNSERDDGDQIYVYASDNGGDSQRCNSQLITVQVPDLRRQQQQQQHENGGHQRRYHHQGSPPGGATTEQDYEQTVVSHQATDQLSSSGGSTSYSPTSGDANRAGQQQQQQQQQQQHMTAAYSVPSDNLKPNSIYTTLETVTLPSTSTVQYTHQYVFDGGFQNNAGGYNYTKPGDIAYVTYPGGHTNIRGGEVDTPTGVYIKSDPTLTSSLISSAPGSGAGARTTPLYHEQPGSPGSQVTIYGASASAASSLQYVKPSPGESYWPQGSSSSSPTLEYVSAYSTIAAAASDGSMMYNGYATSAGNGSAASWASLPLPPAHPDDTTFDGGQVMNPADTKECASCSNSISSSMAMWRRDSSSSGQRYICSNCSVYKMPNAPRPPLRCGGGKMKQSVISSGRRVGVRCANCSTSTTTLWRRNNNGDPVCNACGLYFKLHNVNRPMTMKKDEIQTRKRKPKNHAVAGGGSGAGAGLHHKNEMKSNLLVDSKLQLNMYEGGDGGASEQRYLGTLTTAQLGHAHSPLTLPSAAALNRLTTLTVPPLEPMTAAGRPGADFTVITSSMAAQNHHRS